SSASTTLFANFRSEVKLYLRKDRRRIGFQMDLQLSGLHRRKLQNTLVPNGRLPVEFNKGTSVPVFYAKGLHPLAHWNVFLQKQAINGGLLAQVNKQTGRKIFLRSCPIALKVAIRQIL